MASVVQSRYLPRNALGSGILRRLAALFTATNAPAQPLFGDNADLIAKAQGLRAMELKQLAANVADRR